MKTIVSLIFSLVFLAVAASAQSGQAQANTGTNHELPFAAGETLNYEGKISKFISVPFGDITLAVPEAPEAGKLRLKFDARSRGSLFKLFMTFVQQIDATASERDLRALRATKHDVQKQRVRDSVATYDYEDLKVTWFETNPEEPTKPPRAIASDLEGPTYDIVTAIYFLRTLPMSVGYTTSIDVADSGLVYKIPVRVAARERVKTVLGNVWCYRVEPEIFGPGRFFEQKGKMEMWITDDARRIPVRARANAEIGKVDIRLKEAKGLK